MNIQGIDDIDRTIIKLLVDDARLSYSEIGKKVGLSRVAVKNRIKAIEDEGIIKGYHAEIDPLVTPKMSTFVAVIKTTAASYEEISEMLVKQPCVKTLQMKTNYKAIFHSMGCCRFTMAAHSCFIDKHH